MAQVTHCREFDGTDDYITFSAGSVTWNPATPSATSIAMVVRRDVIGVEQGLFLPATASGATPVWGLMFDNTNVGFTILPADNSLSTGMTFLATDGWMIIGVSATNWNAVSASGPRFHKYVFSTTTWTHAQGVRSSTGVGGTPTSIRMGTHGTGADFDGALIAAAVWNSNLSDADYVSLASGFGPWLTLSPAAAWLFNQTSTGTAVQDVIGGADQSAITGTSVGTSGLPTFDDGVAAGNRPYQSRRPAARSALVGRGVFN